MNKFALLTIAFTLFTFTGCANVGTNNLYTDLGGKEGVDKLVRSIVELSHNDPGIKVHFDGIDDDNLITQLNAQICMLADGGCTYEGLEMLDAHAGMELTEAEFDIFVDVVIKAMEANNISFSAQNRLLALFAPMRRDIIHQ